jgi:hypothetical protein
MSQYPVSGFAGMVKTVKKQFFDNMNPGEDLPTILELMRLISRIHLAPLSTFLELIL